MYNALEIQPMGVADNWLDMLAGLILPVEDGDVKPMPGGDLEYRDWLALYCASTASAAMGTHHDQAWEWIESLKVGVKPPAFVACWARGLGKSSTIELGISRTAVKATRKFALYVSCSQGAANKHVQSVAATMEKIGIERALNKYGFSKGWSADMLRTANGFNVLAFGLDGGTRGVKLGDTRPDWIIFDDVDELGDTVDAVQKKIDIITQTILPAGSIDCAVSFLQNKIHANSVMSRIVSGELDMLQNRVQSPVVVSVDDLKYVSVSHEDGRTRHIITEGTPTWAGKPLDVCQAELDTMGLIAWLRECQQEIGVGGAFFPDFHETKNGKPWHVCDPFPIPSHWDVWASHDYGTGAACAYYLYTADEAGNIYIIAELYEAGIVSSVQSLKAMELGEKFGFCTPDNVSQRMGRWTTRVNRIAFDYASTFPPANPHERIGEYPVEVWWRMGHRAIHAVKDRVAGWRNMKEWLAATRTMQGDFVPAVRIFRGACPNLVQQLSKAMANPKDPENLDPGFREDHGLDSCRYGLMVRPRASKPVPTVDTTPYWRRKKTYTA